MDKGTGVTSLKSTLVAGAAALVMIAGGPAWAQTAPASQSDGAAAGPQLRVQTRAADDSGYGVTLRLQYTGEAADNAIGGLRDGATYMNNILAQLHVDTGQAFGWTGGRIVLEAFYENANSLDTGYVGAAQDPSAIDTSGVAMARVYQAYYTQDLGATNLLFGIYDLETEFGATRPMDVFFNGAYAWTTTFDQSGLNGPSTYPSTALAFRVRQTLSDAWSIQAAILDGVPDSMKHPEINAVNLNKNNGALLVAEVDYTPSRTSKVMAGYWNYTGTFESLSETDSEGGARQVYGSRGGYIGGATRIYSPAPRRGLDVFANVGFASADTQQIDQSYSAGLVYTGLLPGRPFDKLGFAVGVARAGNPYRQMQIASGAGVRTYETNFELTYRAPITRWLTIQPDIQYWINPNMDPTIRNDLLFLIHFELSHVFDF